MPPLTSPDTAASSAAIAAFLSHLTVGGVTAHLLQWAKTQPGLSRFWGILSDRAKVICGAVLAGLGSIGITAALHHDPQAAGVWTITLSGLTGPSLWQHGVSFVQSWVLQQGWYSAIISPAAPAKPVPVVAVAPASGR